MTTTSTSTPQSITAYLAVRDASAAIAFYTRAFGAREDYRLTEPGGKVGHAELVIGASRIMLADEYPDFGALSPATVGGSPVKMHLRVPDADVAMRQALAAGATELRPLKTQFHGERSGLVLDPFGYSWFIATLVEEVSPAEMQRRFTAALVP
ncbi:MAG: VOC family protein [Acidobacteria bacterium]|nr:VOC family protein [Acidobacteriota bacterium]